MLVNFKQGVLINGVKPEIVLAMNIIQHAIFDCSAQPCTFTSIVDGLHGIGSEHYIGHAVDIRTNHMSVELRSLVTRTIRERLTVEYQVIDEQDHIHVEFDPQKGINLK